MITRKSLKKEIDFFKVKLTEMQSQLESIASKVQFLDDNSDAIEMWIDCVRQTQQLYQESQKPVDTCEG